MSDGTGLSRKHGQSSGSGRTMTTTGRQQPYFHEPISSKRVCFYKSGDAQFGGLPVVINSRTFKTFESLLDSLSRRVPLPFGVRTITTPRGHTTVRSLEQLHHGHNYICSDQRTVKPVDLERARRRPPPWYHPRQVSAPRRREQSQQRDQIRSRTRRRRRREATPHLLSTPRRLVVFRNGRPEEKHTVLLQKKSARSFEALLDYVSEVMHFPVVKLYMPDGHRVDGLPALILCSGVLVAAGREPFKVGDYDVQRPMAPTWLPAKRVDPKWAHPTRRKKKSASSSVRSRIFSPSSERFFVNQIHNSVAESMGDAVGSVEMENGNALGSLNGTDILTYGEANDTQALPDDDIEKSFRVNQDGSMTVEMKVRLTIKEEETVHWTTTLSRSTVPNQIMDSSMLSGEVEAGMADFPPPPEHEDDSDIAANESAESQELVPPIKNSSSETSEPAREKEEEQTGQVKVFSPIAARLPTPGPRKEARRQIQSPVEKILEGSETEVHREVVGTYSYREQKQEYCIMQQTSRPVPKPRNVQSGVGLQSQYTDADILKLQENAEEIRETVLHIYEQQTCQDNFLANTQFRVREVAATYSHPTSPDTVLPASSERTPHNSSSLDWDADQNPSTTSKSNSEGKLVDQVSSLNSNTHTGEAPTATDSGSNTVTGEKASESNQQTTETSADSQGQGKKRKPVTFSQAFQGTASEKKRRENVAEILKGVRKRKNSPATSTRPKTAERLKAKSAQRLLKKRHKMRPPEYEVTVSDMSAQQPTEIITTQATENQNELSKQPNEPVADEKKIEKSDVTNVQQKRNVLEVEAFRGKAALIRQTSMHEEKQPTPQTAELSESVSLPALNSSSSMINEYVEQWLLSSRHDVMADMDEESPFNVHPASQSASQIADDPKALFQISSDGEGSTGAETNNDAENPGNDVPSNSVPCIVQSHILQDSNKTAEPSPPQSQNSSHKSNDLESVAIQTDLSLLKSSLPGNHTLENNADPVKNAVATDIQPCEVAEDTPLPLPRGITLEKKQAVHSSPKKSSPPNTDVKKVQVSGISNFERTRSRYESQRKADNGNQMTKKHQTSGQALAQAPINSPTSPKASIAVTPKEKTQIVNASTTEGNAVSSDSNRQSNGQTLKSITSTVIPTPTGSYTVRMAARPDMKPVVEQVCLSIQSIKVTSRQTRPSCLEKSNSLPDFSSHIASTFGSSSRVLLAFLSVMALKDGLSNLNSNKQLGIDNLIYSEALRLLNSLKELAKIEDAQVLSESLSALQNSISRRLLQSWRGFQELSEQARSCSVNSNSSTSTSTSSGSDGPADIGQEEEKAIEELMGELGVPERVREELAAIHSKGETSLSKQRSAKDSPQLMDEVSQFHSAKMALSEKVTDVRNQDIREQTKAKSDKASDVRNQDTGEQTKAKSDKASDVRNQDIQEQTKAKSDKASDVRNQDTGEQTKAKSDKASDVRNQDTGEQTIAVNSPKHGTVTVQQSVEYFKEDRDSTENIKSHHEESALEASYEITECPPSESTVISAHSVPSAEIQPTSMPYNDPLNVRLSSTNLMEKSDESNRPASEDQVEDQVDQKCQFSYMESQADYTAESQAEYEIRVDRLLSDEDQEVSQEKEESNTEIESRSIEPSQEKYMIDVTIPEYGSEEDVIHAESESLKVQSDAEEKPSSPEDNTSTHDYEYEESVKVQSDTEEKPSSPEDNKSTHDFEYEDGVKVQSDTEEKPSSPEDNKFTHDYEYEEGVKILSDTEEKPSSPEDNKSTHDFEYEGDTCDELMGFSEDPDECEKPSDTEMQQATPTGDEYATNSDLTSLPEENNDHMDKLRGKGEQGGSSPIQEPYVCQMKNEGEKEHRDMESPAVTKDEQDHDNGQKVCTPSPVISDSPACYTIHQESYLAEPQWTKGTMTSHHTTILLYPTEIAGLVSNLEPPKPPKPAKRSKNESHIEVRDAAKDDELTSVSHLSDEQTKIEEFMAVVPGIMQSQSVKETQETAPTKTRASPPLIDTTTSSAASSRKPSPLAFSYDSRSRDSDGSPQPNRVKSIREMFLAKSSSDKKAVIRKQPSPLKSAQSDSYPGTSDSGATGTQTSTDNSSADEDAGRLSIAKGYVRRTIERLYGKPGSGKTYEASSRPVSASKSKRREAILHNTVRNLTALHEARSSVMTELSYFNAKSSIDVANESTQCTSLTAQAESPNTVRADEGRWQGQDDHPQETTTPEETMQRDIPSRGGKEAIKEDAPYSHFSSVESVKVDVEEPVSHCAYLTLPHQGDSEHEEDEGREKPRSEADASKKKKREVQRVAPITEPPKPSVNKNTALPGFFPEFKKADNKVHPLMNILPLAPPVVSQPTKRQDSQPTQKAVHRSPNTTLEPDFLDTLYIMCGENCPFL